MDREYDVVIAGAGPAGCAAAIVLKDAGLSVCLADRVERSKRKPGESLPGATLRLLHRLGFDRINTVLADEDFRACTANASCWGSNEWVYQDGLMNPEGGGWQVHREHFDEALRNRAASLGIPFYPSWIDRVQDNGIYTVRLTDNPAPLRAKYLIDATGRKARLARRMNLVRQPFDEQLAAVCWIKAHNHDRDQATRIKAVADGWWYSALLPGGHRVISLQSTPAHVASLMKDRITFLSSFNETSLLPYPVRIEDCLEFQAVKSGMARTSRAASDRFLCVGDAALSLDPLSSQGIFFALYSGIKAAEALIEGSTKAMEKYEAAVNRVWTSNLQSCRYFYAAESRYASKEYWQERRKNFSTVLLSKIPAGAFA